MDLWRTIQADEANLHQLFEQVLRAIGPGVKSRDRLFHALAEELEGYLSGKEEVLYPALARDERTRSYLDALADEHEEMRWRIEELAASPDKDMRTWTLRFRELMHAFEHHCILQRHGVLTVTRGIWDEEAEEELRAAYQREKLSALQARRWHVPQAVVPSRYGVSTGAVVGTLLGVAAVTAAAVLWRSAQRKSHLDRNPSPLPPRRRGRMHAHEMISSHPHVNGNTNDALIRCIDECYSCAQICTSCADACLGEGMVQQLTQCIRLNLDCADVCAATGSVATRRTGANEEVIRRMLEACATACRLCGQECEKHAGMHEHCRICAESCRRCEQACRDALVSMAPGRGR